MPTFSSNLKTSTQQSSVDSELWTTYKDNFRYMYEDSDSSQTQGETDLQKKEIKGNSFDNQPCQHQNDSYRSEDESSWSRYSLTPEDLSNHIFVPIKGDSDAERCESQ